MDIISNVHWIPIATILAGIFLLALAKHLYQHRGKPGANWFMLALSLQSFWCFFYGTALLISDPQLHYTLEVLSWIGFIWIGYLFLSFTLEYTGRGSPRDPQMLLLAVIPFVASLAIVIPSLNSYLWTEATLTTLENIYVLEYEFTIWAHITILTALGYSVVGVLLLVEAVLSYGPLYRKEALSVAISTLPPAFAVLAWLFQVGPFPNLNLAGILSIPHAVFDAYAFVGTNMFESNPTTQRAAEQTAIDDLPNPVFILDTDHTVVRTNKISKTRFKTPEEPLTGQTITDITGTEFSPSSNTNIDTDSTPEFISLSTDIGMRQYTLLTSALTDPTNTIVGYTVVLQDVTQQRERSQRLNVFNRILRHNLRNKMAVVDGFATEIENVSTDSSIQNWANKIRSNSSALQEIGTKARTFDSIRENGTNLKTIKISKITGELKSTFEANHANATVHTSIDPELTVFADENLLSLALENLIENAIEHNPSDTQQVWLQASPIETDSPGKTVELVVRDDGPGVNETDIQAIRSDTETSLIHGSSIGLWIVKWSVNAIGGTISFDISDDGTEATMSLRKEEN